MRGFTREPFPFLSTFYQEVNNSLFSKSGLGNCLPANKQKASLGSIPYRYGIGLAIYSIFGLKIELLASGISAHKSGEANNLITASVLPNSALAVLHLPEMDTKESFLLLAQVLFPNAVLEKMALLAAIQQVL